MPTTLTAQTRKWFTRHAPTPGDTRAPNIPHGSTANADNHLLVRVDYGWVSDQTRGLLVVQPQHTWLDLADSILTMFFRDPGDHLFEFTVRHDHRPHNVHGIWMENRPAFSLSDGDIVIANYEGDAHYIDEHNDQILDVDERVNRVLGPGSFAWFRWDLGTPWPFAIRVIGTLPSDAHAATRTPTMIVPPLDAGFVHYG